MPTLSQVRQSNTALGAQRQKMVAVFVGGTSGIGEATAKQMALAVKQPTIHLVGRNPASGSRVLEELRASNPNGSYNFIQSDVSLLRSVDKACEEITDKEKQIDLLFMSTGHLSLSKNETDEGLDDNHALRYYSRMRFVQRLMPLLSASSGPARVVSILAGGQEGTMEEDNFDLRKSWSFTKGNTYAATLNSLAIEHLATAHPTVSFLHVFPGIVRTPLMNASFGNYGGAILSFLSRPISMSPEESGERNLFLSTSAAYPPATPKDPSQLGVPLVKGVDTASASTGKVGGGSYILKYDGSNATREKLMADYRARSFPGKVWDHTLETFKRVLRSD
ncbi:short-chain dehydrogenases/reductase [Aspergillus niger]|uniref:short-chain dehydrogenase/reductase n=1 Tax=Aspergillus lacticoffeatus (strain CBS 101883) TaxID=1450533 RepID=UPI000D80135D|nr:short-chain dehydrogenase/reductase [Aspergillus niger CBS 101883]PYH53242.1 short-chain dehydrogenase/reductase [Aspergillus niger CBS 101883]GJP88564.1 short-chain dehydrogenases/reductase [Aspergillus niger]